jgi:hypothetical protein
MITLPRSDLYKYKETPRVRERERGGKGGGGRGGGKKDRESERVYKERYSSSMAEVRVRQLGGGAAEEPQFFNSFLEYCVRAATATGPLALLSCKRKVCVY